MSFRLYLVPVIGIGTKSDPRRAKYFSDGTLVDNPVSSSIDYGFEPWMVVGADLSSTDDAIIVSKPDAHALPIDLSTNLTAQQVSNTQAFLESSNIPAGWININLTWAQVVRAVLGIFSYLQRYGAIYASINGITPPSLFSGAITLDSTFGSLPQLVQNALIAAAQSFNISTTGLTAGTTIRVILRAIGSNLDNQPYNFNGTII